MLAHIEFNVNAVCALYKAVECAYISILLPLINNDTKHDKFFISSPT